jgi:hypothetical protein
MMPIQRVTKTNKSVLIILSTLLVAPITHAATQEEVIAELQAQVAALSQRLNSLETRRVPEVQYETAAVVAQNNAAQTWADRIKLKGDFRFRQEHIDADNSSSRNRQRIRARTELTAELLDTVDVGFGLATGDDDPVSSNQTLGEGSSSKGINLDLAYVKWQTPVDGLSILAGKYKNTMRRVGGNGLVWDGDLRPEGSAAVYKQGNWFGTAQILWTDESSTDDDTVVWGAQAGWQGDIGNTNLLLGGGYEHFETAGEAVFFDGDPRGNSVDAAGNYLYDYQDLELFAELRLDIAGVPTMLFVDYTQNLDADDFDTGYAIGGEMSFKNSRHPWKLGYTYQDLEADATFGLFSDSDFIGGGTDGKGHIIRGSYSLTKAIALGGTLFVNERGGNAGESEDYNRLMLDIAFKY